MKSIRSFRLLAAALLALFVQAQSPDSNGPNSRAHDRPNILFILADDLGYGDLGCYGQKTIKTPNLDRMAAEGARFTQCYAGSTVCAPSRASLMTGFHTGHARIRGNERVPLTPEDITIATVLKRAGYMTAAIGKWGLGNEGTTGTPNKKGFDEWFGYLDQVHAHNYYPDHLWRNDQRWPVVANAGDRKVEYSTDLFTRAALDFLQTGRQRPFFLYLAYTAPHANNELKEKGMEVPNDSPYSNEPWPQPEKNKAAMITRLDNDIGRILDQLKRSKLDGNTIVFVSSDNGPHREGGVDPAFFHSAGPLRGIKRDLYEGGIRVPLIARWPGKIPPGSVNQQVIAFWDFLPTLAAIAQTTGPDKTDGISVLPALLGQKQTDQHEFLYWEFHENGTRQAVRMGNWKALRPAPDTPLELYDLTSDLAESTNLASARLDVVGKVEKHLKTARIEDAHWPIKASSRNNPSTNRPSSNAHR